MSAFNSIVSREQDVSREKDVSREQDIYDGIDVSDFNNEDKAFLAKLIKNERTQAQDKEQDKEDPYDGIDVSEYNDNNKIALAKLIQSTRDKQREWTAQIEHLHTSKLKNIRREQAQKLAYEKEKERKLRNNKEYMEIIESVIALITME